MTALPADGPASMSVGQGLLASRSGHRHYFCLVYRLGGPSPSRARRSRPGLAQQGGLACNWQQKCMRSQQKLIEGALGYVKKAGPPTWRIHLCQPQCFAQARAFDWVGIDNCIRNAALVMPRPGAETPMAETAGVIERPGHACVSDGAPTRSSSRGRKCTPSSSKTITSSGCR